VPALSPSLTAGLLPELVERDESGGVPPRGHGSRVERDAGCGIGEETGVDIPGHAVLLAREPDDAFRHDDPVYVVASEAFPHDVIDVYPDYEAARFAADTAGIDFHVYGPFVTPGDAGLPLVVLGCYKDDITTRYVCPPLMGVPQDPVFRMEEVDSIRVTFFSNLRGPISMNMARPPSGMIFTLDAFDRFIAPYYLHLFGPEYVVQMREEMMGYIRRGLGER